MFCQLKKTNFANWIPLIYQKKKKKKTRDNRSKNKLNFICTISGDVPHIVTNGRFTTIFYNKQDKLLQLCHYEFSTLCYNRN